MLKILLILGLSLMCIGESVAEASLQGSREAVLHAYQKAQLESLSFLQTGEEIRSFVEKGFRVEVKKSEHLALRNDVSYPYAVPATDLLLRRLSAQFFAACKERLVVTSLMRPIDEQPTNASSFSVHPTGMAVDLRIPANSECRSWIERTLLLLEERAVLDVTRELNPPHYHVVVYPKEYAAYVDSKVATEVEPKNTTWLQLAQEHVGIAALLLGVAVAVWLLLWFFAWKRWRIRGFASSRWLVIVASVVLGATLFVFGYQALRPQSGWEVRSNELVALATALYWEGALLESSEGLHAIAWTIFNRQESSDYPDTVREVVTAGIRPGRRDGCQFSFACDGQVELPERLCELHPNDSKVLGFAGCEGRYASYLIQAAWFMTLGRGEDPTNGAVLYYTGATPYWVVDCEDDSIRKIGSHTFCRSKWNN